MKFWEAMKSLQEGHKIRLEIRDHTTGYCYYKLKPAQTPELYNPLVKVMMHKGGQVDAELPLSVDDYAYLMMHLDEDWDVIY